MWSTVAISSAMWIGWARGKRTTARPMRMRWVRAAMALAIVMGEDKTLIGEKWYSASHTELTPRASAASTNAKHSAKASRSVIPSRHGNSMKSPKSKLADPGKVSLGDLRSWGLRCDDVHRDSPSAGGFHVGQSFLLGGIGIGGKLHLDPVRIQEVDAAGHAVPVFSSSARMRGTASTGPNRWSSTRATVPATARRARGCRAHPERLSVHVEGERAAA